jgi:transposase-like protein
MNKTKHEKDGAANAVVEPKRYEEAFKRPAVEHWLRSGRNGAQIARELGMSSPSLKEWKRRSGSRGPRAACRVGTEARAARHSKKTPGLLSEVPRLVTSAAQP